MKVIDRPYPTRIALWENVSGSLAIYVQCSSNVVFSAGCDSVVGELLGVTEPARGAFPDFQDAKEVTPCQPNSQLVIRQFIRPRV